MKLPKSFVIHGHTITVNIVEFCDDPSVFGTYNDVTEEITIATKIMDGTKIHELSQIQIEHTFLHELIHCFQFHVKGEFDEGEAQAYSGLLIEFFKTSGIKIDPNVINEPINNDNEYI
jgi:hypothetical protein